MPHTSRRKRPAQDSKRKNTPLGDGWTLISRSPAAAAAAVKDAISPSDHGKSVSSDSLHSADAAAPENSPSNSSAAHQPKIGPRLLMPDITLSDLKREYAAYQKRWKASTCREKLCSVRNGVVGDYLAASDDGIGIQQRCFWSVCVGLGSLCEEPRDRSMWQLVVWMGVCDALDSMPGFSPLQRTVQDPRFTPVDVSFFSHLNITILSPPEASISLCARTFLFAPFLDLDVLLPQFLASPYPRPDLAILSGVEVVAENGDYHSDEQSEDERKKGVQAAKRFVEGGQRADMPRLEEDVNALLGLRVWWSRDMDWDAHWEERERKEAEEKEAKDSGSIRSLIEGVKKKL